MLHRETTARSTNSVYQPANGIQKQNRPQDLSVLRQRCRNTLSGICIIDKQPGISLVVLFFCFFFTVARSSSLGTRQKGTPARLLALLKLSDCNEVNERAERVSVRNGTRPDTPFSFSCFHRAGKKGRTLIAPPPPGQAEESTWVAG